MHLDTTDKIFLSLIMIAIISAAYLLIRNHWVYNERDKIIKKNVYELDNYRDYNSMFHDFFVWDIEKMKKETK